MKIILWEQLDLRSIVKLSIVKQVMVVVSKGTGFKQFNQQLLEAEEWFKQKRIEANGGTVTLKIGVILVDFADSVHYIGTEEIFPYGYYREYFNDMIFSNNGDWYDPALPTNGKHPENKRIFGSLRDYYNQQSSGKLDIIGKDGIYPEILNPPDPQHPLVPDWVYPDETKAYWEDQPLENSFWNEAVDKFQLKFPNINLSIYDIITFIYAGKEPNSSSSSLWPKSRLGENLYLIQFNICYFNL
jgi:bacillopeptidase F (M6 metalloprotease family)